MGLVLILLPLINYLLPQLFYFFLILSIQEPKSVSLVSPVKPCSSNQRHFHNDLYSDHVGLLTCDLLRQTHMFSRIPQIRK